jgi:hypothetical protein
MNHAEHEGIEVHEGIEMKNRHFSAKKQINNRGAGTRPD